jgi:addiction module HigA family antidote
MARTPIHPGDILSDELRELGISAVELARLIHVPANRVSQILSGKRHITADTALRLGRWFGTGPQLWLNLQQAYDLDLARQQLGEALEAIEPRVSVAVNAWAPCARLSGWRACSQACDYTCRASDRYLLVFVRCVSYAHGRRAEDITGGRVKYGEVPREDV